MIRQQLRQDRRDGSPHRSVSSDQNEIQHDIGYGSEQRNRDLLAGFLFALHPDRTGNA